MLPGKPWGFQSGEAPQLAQYLQEKKSLVSKPKTSCRDVVLMLQGKRTSHPLGKLLPPLPAAAEDSPSHSHWQSRAGLPFSPSGVSPNQCPQGHSGVISVAGKQHYFLCDTTFQVRPKLSVCASYQPQNTASQVSGREDWTHIG